MRTLTALFLSFLLCACSALTNTHTAETPANERPNAFTTENLMKVHQGMTSKEVLAMFGEPKNVSLRACGRPPDQWTCTMWEYGKYPHDRAFFAFSGEHDSLKLNSFNIDRD